VRRIDYIKKLYKQRGLIYTITLLVLFPFFIIYIVIALIFIGFGYSMMRSIGIGSDETDEIVSKAQEKLGIK